ncbi:uncharacterized protein LOC123667925 isoform X1 [Melitaea cinxia]|uniref:uncharacterized protein LOC123667925 isoform X1 n=1 Tax=Melitaea cinxia TaxID=113334 RepID=UPI001E2716A4|nr:uncharacterized protein LOC123667925 isoform X1 [Melitaea cinxia]
MDIDQSNSNMDIGSMIKDQVVKSMKNVDVMSLLKNMAATATDNQESGEIQSKLQDILEKYNNMPEDMKAEFTGQLKDLLVKKLATKLKDAPINFSGLEEAIQNEIVTQMYYIGAGVFVLIVIIVFFGYKLYKSIKEKEKKREEKKKLKQMKKKK